MTTFFLVRHGMTPHTGHKLSGLVPDVALTDEGLAQAEQVAQSLAAVPFKAIYSSPILRCTQTARPIAARHGLRVRTRPGLREVEFGRWANRSFKELRRTKLWSKVQRWPSAARFPGGESLREVQSRAVDVIEELCEEHPKETICVVSHAEVIRLIAAHYLGLHLDLFQRIVVFPASTTVVEVGDEGPRLFVMNAPPSSRWGKS